MADDETAGQTTLFGFDGTGFGQDTITGMDADDRIVFSVAAEAVSARFQTSVVNRIDLYFEVNDAPA